MQGQPFDWPPMRGLGGRPSQDERQGKGDGDGGKESS